VWLTDYCLFILMYVLSTREVLTDNQILTVERFDMNDKTMLHSTGLPVNQYLGNKVEQMRHEESSF
jgi:hypothetical protein